MKHAHLTQVEIDAFPEGAVWNAFVQLMATSEFHELGAEQLPAFRAYWYDTEVFNGGHLQYFLNRGVEEALLAVEDLRSLGYLEHGEVLARAIGLWRAQPQGPLESVEQYTRLAGQGDFDQMDEDHASIKPGILDRLEAHLERHQDDFVRIE